MLTKEERAAIAERFRNYDKAEYVTLYSGMYDGLLGEHVPKETTVKKDRMELASRILELCDTSNMLELPVDKDGEVIHIGDTVYDDDNLKYEVVGYMSTDQNIILKVDGKTANILAYAETLTHKQLVTAKSLAQRIRDVLRNDHSEMSPYTSRELVHIANDLERLGDNNE
jgi:hypothetical protein|nr:MAG TPA: hypothetical protein [Caudoviricetes sp.]